MKCRLFFQEKCIKILSYQNWGYSRIFWSRKRQEKERKRMQVDLKRKRLKKIRYLVLFITVLEAVRFGSRLLESRDLESILKYTDGDKLVFSVNESFLTEDTELEIRKNSKMPEGVDIYYTLDGSEPTEEAVKYTEPVLLSSGERIKVIPVRAALYYKGEMGESWTRTYFTGKQLKERYDQLVVSIVTDYENVLGENGILVEGSDPEKPNYKESGRESERPVYVEILDQDGTLLLSQSCGMRVSGNGSREYSQKSLKLYARREYGNHSFYFDRFCPAGNEKKGERDIFEYDKLVLKNGGNDWKRAMIRSNICNSLGRQAGYEAVPDVIPAAVYINGIYYGLSHLQPDYSQKYLGSVFELPKDQIEVLSGDENDLYEETGLFEVFYQDMTKEENRKRLEQRVDMESFLKCFAMQIYFENVDWPWHNVKMWRYTGAEIQDNEYSDGKWRYLLFDNDQTFDFFDLDLDTMKDIFENLLDQPQDNNKAFSYIMAYEGYRQYFANYLCDLMAGPLENGNVITTVQTEDSKVVNEISHILEETVIYEKMEEIVNNREKQMNRVYQFALKREREVRNYIGKYMGASGPYTLTVMPPKPGAKILWNTQELDCTGAVFIGTYYKSVPVKISCETARGYEFDYWLVNGSKVMQESFEIRERMGYRDQISIELHLKPEEQTPVPVIYGFSAADNNDWIELYNPYERPVSLLDFYLSDKEEELKQYHCPDVKLEPHQKIKIYGKKQMILKEYVLNFSLSSGETVCLTGKNGEVLEKMKIPEMEKGEYYGKDASQIAWKFYKEENK